MCQKCGIVQRSTTTTKISYPVQIITGVLNGVEFCTDTMFPVESSHIHCLIP